MGIFFRRSRAANSAVLGPIRPKFDLVQDNILLLSFFLQVGKRSNLAEIRTRPGYNIVVLVTCKYEEDPIKNESAKVLTRLYVVF